MSLQSHGITIAPVSLDFLCSLDLVGGGAMFCHNATVGHYTGLPIERLGKSYALVGYISVEKPMNCVGERPDSIGTQV